MNIVKQTLIKAMSKRSRPMMEHAFTVIGELSRAFYEKDGKEALPIIAEISSRSGEARAKIMQRMMSVKDMKDVGELFKMMDLSMDIGMELIEISDNVIHFKLPKCVLKLEGTSRELCEAAMAADEKMIHTLLGQEVETKIIKSVAAGDKNCEVIFTKK